MATGLKLRRKIKAWKLLQAVHANLALDSAQVTGALFACPQNYILPRTKVCEINSLQHCTMRCSLSWLHCMLLSLRGQLTSWGAVRATGTSGRHTRASGSHGPCLPERRTLPCKHIASSSPLQEAVGGLHLQKQCWQPKSKGKPPQYALPVLLSYEVKLSHCSDQTPPMLAAAESCMLIQKMH